MNNSHRSSFLRLIVSRNDALPKAESDLVGLPGASDEEGRNQKKEKERQYYLPLPELNSAFVLQSSAIRHGKLKNLIENFNAKWIFDARPTPTLGSIAESRAQAFDFFRKFSINYIDVYGRLIAARKENAHTYPENWGGEVWNILLKSQNRNGPFVFIFSDDRSEEELERAIGEKLQSYIGSDVRCTSLA